MRVIVRVPLAEAVVICDRLAACDEDIDKLAEEAPLALGVKLCVSVADRDSEDEPVTLRLQLCVRLGVRVGDEDGASDELPVVLGDRLCVVLGDSESEGVNDSVDEMVDEPLCEELRGGSDDTVCVCEAVPLALGVTLCVKLGVSVVDGDAVRVREAVALDVGGCVTLGERDERNEADSDGEVYELAVWL